MPEPSPESDGACTPASGAEEKAQAPLWWKITAAIIVAAIALATGWIVEERSKPPPPPHPIGELP
jgi:hypothetical protein